MNLLIKFRINISISPFLNNFLNTFRNKWEGDIPPYKVIFSDGWVPGYIDFPEDDEDDLYQIIGQHSEYYIIPCTKYVAVLLQNVKEFNNAF